MAANVGKGPDTSPSDRDLQACYEAFVRRRRVRGERSLRTPAGFQRLQKRYQSVPGRKNVNDPSKPAEAELDPGTAQDDDVGVRQVLDVFFNSKILTVITESCWPLALFGGGATHTDKECAGLELDEEKYSNFSSRLIQWVFPELPRREVQELAHYDWEHDRKFDDVGQHGLSSQGFKLSLLDLAVACTDGSVAKCLEFLKLISRWLQHSLPPYSTRDIVPPAAVQHLMEATTNLKPLPKPVPVPVSASITWETIPLSMMTPCPVSPQGLLCELKAKICPAPMAIVVLADDENPIELVLATSSKLLLNKSENRANVYRKVAVDNALCGELKRQGCWTFSMRPSTPSIVMVPNAHISRQTKALYASFRAFDVGNRVQIEAIGGDDNNEASMSKGASPEANNAPTASSFLTLFTSIPDQCTLLFDSKSSACCRMERMTTRMFTVDHSASQGEAFTIVLKAGLLQNANSVGGPGAAAALSSAFEATSTFRISESYSPTGSLQGDGRLLDTHTLLFILKSSELTAPRQQGLKQSEAALPQQWFTSLNAANETKSIVVEASSNPSATREAKRTEIYHLFVFTLHGIFIEVACSSGEPGQHAQSEDSDVERQDQDGSEGEHWNEFSRHSEMPVTSAGLLKELLLFRRMRHLEQTSEPPPALIIGTSMSTTKPVTTAESLRSKILRSRQEERRARFLQLEAAVRDKLQENKSRRKQPTAREPDRAHDKLEEPPSPNAELEKRVDLLTSFFHEMAVHQPRLDELHGSEAEAAEAVAEEQLLQRFGAIFDRDEDLQNALDEEKWSTDTAKVARRRASISTNLPKITAAEGITGTRDEIEGDKIPWTFEDYENTAQYIEQLMEDVATHATQRKELDDEAAAERKRAVMTQLIASWQYSQHRVSKAATCKKLKEIEQKRRSQWMQSQHVQVYGAVAAARRGDKPERPALILPKQRFLVQEQSLPSTAVWEVPGSPTNQTTMLASGPIAAAGLVSPARPATPDEGSQSPSKVRPQRPATVTSVARPSSTIASRSAAIARARVRRIRSAHSTSPGDPSPQRLPARRVTSVLSPRDLESEEEPPSATPSTSDRSVEADSNPIHDTPDTESKEDEVFASTVEIRAASTAVEAREASAASPEKTLTKSAVRKRRLRKKRRAESLSAARFRRQVLELASIAAKLRAAADEEQKQAQDGVDELSSAAFLLTRRSTRPRPIPER